jgi:hypothetical protein
LIVIMRKILSSRCGNYCFFVVRSFLPQLVQTFYLVPFSVFVFQDNFIILFLDN